MSDIAKAVGDIPSGLFVVAVARESGEQDGFLASWVQQLSFSPLLIGIAIKKERNIFQDIEQGALFSVNVVGERNRELMKPFWNGYTAEDNPFTHLAQQRHSTGAILLEDAKSVIICRKKDIIYPGDHALVIAEVLDSVVYDTEGSSVVHFRKSGATY